MEAVSSFGIDSKYGKVTVEKKTLLDGEPVFLLRARDKQSVAAIRHYAVSCELAGCSDEFIEHLIDEANKFDNWQENHEPFVREKPD
jgi:hypothetical protein